MLKTLLKEKHTLGMVLFIGSEAVFFLMLVLAYVYLRAFEPASFTAASALKPLQTGIFSLFLFASSGTVWLAHRSLSQKRHTALCLWLAATIGLGAIFLIGQGLEWRDLLRQNIDVSQHLFGTTFFTLTGFHGLHVIIGLLLLLITLVLALLGDFKSGHSTAMETISLYWHFVDVVWVVIFCVMYLWTLL